MHEVAVPDPLLALSADLALAAWLIAFRHECWSHAAKVVAEILYDGARLGQYQRLLGSWGFDRNDGGLAQRVHLLELGWSQPVGTTLEGL